MKYCSNCGNLLTKKIPEGDTKERYVCLHCNTIHYQNPKIIVGCIPVYNQDNEIYILLCKRGIKPQYGKWTIPAGFLEIGEKIEEGAIRETKEEANANVSINFLHTVFSIPKIGQVYLLFHANLLNLDFFPGNETLETKLYKISEIPWNELAFSAIYFSLKELEEDKKKNRQGITHIGFFS